MSKCEECEEEVTPKVEKYSKTNFDGYIYCYDCQKKIKAKESTAIPEETVHTNEELAGPKDVRKRVVLLRKELKNLLDSHSRKDVSHYEDSWDIRPSDFKEELLEKFNELFPETRLGGEKE